MATTFEGQGATFTKASLTLGIKDITLPGWSKGEIDVTLLANTDVKTFVLEKLRTIKDFSATMEFDKTPYMAIPEGNSLCVITLPDAAGTISFWGDVKEVGDVKLSTGGQPTVQVTIKVTNRNGSGVETAPF
jgi:hypothetical protein